MILKSIIPEISLPLIKNIETYVQSPIFRKCILQSYEEFQVSFYTEKFSWICLHIWLLKNRVQKQKKVTEIFTAYRIKKSLLRLMQDCTKNHVYDYQQHFDRSVYQQLKRSQSVMFWSLDDYFLYDFKKKRIQQILQEDLSLFRKKSSNFQNIKPISIEEEQIKRIKLLQKTGKYIIKNMNNLQKISTRSLKKNQFQWQI